jgi:hypothetical protein
MSRGAGGRRGTPSNPATSAGNSTVRSLPLLPAVRPQGEHHGQDWLLEANLGRRVLLAPIAPPSASSRTERSNTLSRTIGTPTYFHPQSPGEFNFKQHHDIEHPIKWSETQKWIVTPERYFADKKSTQSKVRSLLWKRERQTVIFVPRFIVLDILGPISAYDVQRAAKRSANESETPDPDDGDDDAGVGSLRPAASKGLDDVDLSATLRLLFVEIPTRSGVAQDDDDDDGDDYDDADDGVQVVEPEAVGKVKGRPRVSRFADRAPEHGNYHTGLAVSTHMGANFLVKYLS